MKVVKLWVQSNFMIHTIDLQFYDQRNVIASYLVETSEGPVLVEVGPHSTFPHLKKGIEDAGYRAEDIRHVFITHVHLDHAGAAWWFAQNGAKVYVHPKGLRHMADPSRLMDSARRIYQSMMDSLWGKMEAIPEELLVAVGNGEKVEIGDQTFIAWDTPGHAVHHISWQMDKVVFTGDVGGVKILGGPVVPPCPPPDIHVEDWDASIELLKGLSPDALYLGHFGRVDDVQTHLNDLQKRLHAYADWMKPHFDEGTDMKEITPLFTEMVQEELRSFGITSEEDLGSYQAANPSWMSVSGLMRYWKKRAERES